MASVLSCELIWSWNPWDHTYPFISDTLVYRWGNWSQGERMLCPAECFRVEWAGSKQCSRIWRQTVWLQGLPSATGLHCLFLVVFSVLLFFILFTIKLSLHGFLLSFINIRSHSAHNEKHVLSVKYNEINY